jgi:hypothetical protein
VPAEVVVDIIAGLFVLAEYEDIVDIDRQEDSFFRRKIDRWIRWERFEAD